MILKIAIILGTRPEIIKMAPIITKLKNNKINFFIIHSGQHYSFNLDKVFFEDLSLPSPDYKLEVGSASPGEQTSRIISRTEKILIKTKPDFVLVQGDTNTVLGGAIASRKLNIPIGHVEAGLRSYDDSMPEEWNRKIADHCSDFLFAPTRESQKILVREGIPKKKIFLVGNTIVDSVNQNISKIQNFEKIKTHSKNYFLVSLHRQENVDNEIRFKNIIKALEKIKKEYQIKIIFPIHPRSKKMAKKFNIKFKGIDIIEPVGYLHFLNLQRNAQLILTDSGGVQEEACILRIPCITLRDNTERPETVQVGANIISGTEPDKILRCVKKMLKQKRIWKNPFGDGKSSQRIIEILKNHS